MTRGARRLAERPQRKLDGDCLLRFDAPVGPRHNHTDFIVRHPRHGPLILSTSATILACERPWRSQQKFHLE
jgi:hypothetical protein